MRVTADRAGVIPPSAAPRAGLGSTLALTVMLATGLFLVAMPLAIMLIPETDLPPPFLDQNQDAETLLFIVAFAGILPLALVATPRVADRIAAGASANALPALAAALTGSLLALLLFAKASERLPWGGGLRVLLVAMLLWCAAAALALRRAASPRPWAPLRAVAARAELLWGAAGVLGVVTVLAFADLGSIAPGPLVAGVLVAGAVLLLSRRRRVARLPRWARIAFDVAAVGLLLLAVPNLVIFTPENPGASFDTNVIQFHQNFFLGPANHVLEGDPMLVDTLSQYGVGSIYFLAGWFQIAPIGNGTLGLLEGILSALTFASGYAVLRLARVPRLLAAAALAVAVVVLVYSLVYPVGAILQQGAIRFGLPIAAIAAALVAERWPGWATGARVGGLMVVGVAAIWALEAFAYTLLTVAGLLAFGAWAVAPGARRRWLGRRVGEVVAACLTAHVLLAGLTLLAAGQLPEWGRYLATLRAFLTGSIGELTYNFSPWAPGLAVGALYLASAAAIVLLIRRRPEVAVGERTTLLALSGTTAYGVALFSYFVNRSDDHILPYVSLPAVMLGALWLSLLLRAPARVSLRARMSGLALALGTCALLVAVAWSSVDERFSQSALAMAAPGGRSLSGALERLWDPPDLSPGASEGERLLERFMPGEAKPLVLTSADLGVEILVRAQRANELPLSDPWEDTLVAQQHLASLGVTIVGLEPGRRMLIDGPAGRIFGELRAQPARAPLTDPITSLNGEPIEVAPLQEWVLKEIGKRYELRTIATGEQGLRVVELVER